MGTEQKKTIILGASNNPSRFSYVAVHRLKQKGYEVVPVGIKKGSVAGEAIRDIRLKPFIDHVDTITLYMNPRNQQAYYDYVLNLRPRRIIFNPGTENPELAAAARDQDIETIFNCTLVMLSQGIY
jgi:predicted CoA-binding protein